MSREYKYAIFGTGKYGQRALEQFGAENICCFIDNDVNKQGESLSGVEILSFDEYKAKYHNYKIVIAVSNAADIIEQITNSKVFNYCVFRPTIHRFVSYWDQNRLVINPYEHGNGDLTEEEWNERIQKERDNHRCKAEKFIEGWKDAPILFRHIEIETYNRCNGGCSFCPVSVANERRPEAKMSEKLFQKIIDELGRYEYSGRLAIFSNNEPFLDDRILLFHKYAREKLPKARMHLYSNGTCLTLERFIELMKYLDELVIDNYNQNLELIPNAKAIKEYCEEHPELIKKVTILLRKPIEILTSRGGDAPNRKALANYYDDPCILPFREMIIRPDGKVSLCCNDPLGKNTMGDVNIDSLKAIWFGNEFNAVRNALFYGRGNWKNCTFCDTYKMD